MTTNRLAKSEVVNLSLPKEEAERRRFWIERGNRLLWGQEPNSDGIFLKPQLDLQWACSKDGHYFIEPRR